MQYDPHLNVVFLLASYLFNLLIQRGHILN